MHSSHSKCQAGKNAPAILYPGFVSFIGTVPHCHEPPAPTHPNREQPSSEEHSNSAEDKVSDLDYRGAAEERNSYYSHQKDLNNLIRDLGLTKSNIKLLTSRFKQWNLLDESVQVTGQRKHHQCFSSNFTTHDRLCFCHHEPVCSRQLESSVTPACGTSSSTDPQASKSAAS